MDETDRLISARIAHIAQKYNIRLDDFSDAPAKKAWRNLKKVGWAPLVLAGIDTDD